MKSYIQKQEIKYIEKLTFEIDSLKDKDKKPVLIDNNQQYKQDFSKYCNYFIFLDF